MRFEQFFYGVCYYPEAWPGEMRERDIDRIADAGFQFVRMGEGAWSYWEPEEGRFHFELFDKVIDRCRQRGVRVILGTPTYAAPAWVPATYPQVLRWNINRLPMAHGSRRNLNYTSPEMLRLSDRICTALADHYRTEAEIIGWQLDNEFNCHMDASYAPSDTLAFRAWCQNRYGSLDELNRAWGTGFWSQTYSNWEQIDLPHPSATYLNPSRLMDESRFISDTVVSFADRQAKILRDRNPDWFITHNGLFGNVDGQTLMPVLDFFSHDQYPLFFPNWQAAAEPLVRARSVSFPFGILEQQAGPGGQMDYLHRTPRPGEMRLWAWQSVIHGASLLSFFRWRTCPYGSEQHWHGLLDADNRDNRRLAEAQILGEEFPKLPPEFLNAPPIRSVGVMRDYDNEINDWRINTYASAGRSEYRLWVAEFLGRHIPVDEVYADSSWDGYELLIVPHHKMTHPSFVQKLSAFVDAGGCVLLGAQCGSKTADVHIVSLPLPGLFGELAGIEVRDWTTLPGAEVRSADMSDGGERLEFHAFVEQLHLTTAEPIAHWTGDDTLLGNGVAISRNAFGAGQVFYIGGYSPPAAVHSLTEMLIKCLKLESTCDAPSDIECVAREAIGRRFICLLNHGKTPHSVHQLPAGFDLLQGSVTGAKVTLRPLDVAIISCPIP